MTTVREYFCITDDDLELLDEKAMESSYWSDVRAFVNKILDADRELLTEKQHEYIKDVMMKIEYYSGR